MHTHLSVRPGWSIMEQSSFIFPGSILLLLCFSSFSFTIYFFIIFCIFKITLAQYDRRRSAFPFVSWFLLLCVDSGVWIPGVWGSVLEHWSTGGLRMLSLLGVRNSGGQRLAFAENVETNNCFSWKKACKMRQMLFALGLGAIPIHVCGIWNPSSFDSHFPHSSHF